MTDRQKPRLGLIGCGAIVEYWHLPSLAAIGWRPAVLVDTNVEQAQRLAKRFKVPHVARSLDDALQHGIEAAIVATPHSVRSSICEPLLSAGINLLVEKPLAITSVECEQIIATEEASGAQISVGYVHRNSPIRRWTTEVLRAGILGEIKSFDIREGSIFNWDIKSGGLWQKEVAGGGVLMDQGTHTCDLVCHWFGEPSSVGYKDDAYGGVEAEALIELEMKSGAKGTVELSRTRDLSNRAIIEGSKGRLEVVINVRNEVIEAPQAVLDFADDGVKPADMPDYMDYGAMFQNQLQDWARSLADDGKPPVPAGDSLRATRLIEACYAARELWELPWMAARQGVKPARVPTTKDGTRSHETVEAEE